MTARPTFVIDGVEVAFSPGQTILDAALAAGVYVPHLCHAPGIPPYGGCRLCVVKVDGRPASACTTAAQPGACVENRTPPLDEARRAVLRMLFVEGDHVCPICEKSGACQLQAAAYELGVTDLRYPQLHRPRAIDASHPQIVLDRNRCILCELCVRAGRELDGKQVFAVSGRGADSELIVNSPSGRLADSAIAAGDRALEVCPTGALYTKQRSYSVPIGHRRFDARPLSATALEPGKRGRR